MHIRMLIQKPIGSVHVPAYWALCTLPPQLLFDFWGSGSETNIHTHTMSHVFLHPAVEHKRRRQRKFCLQRTIVWCLVNTSNSTCSKICCWTRCLTFMLLCTCNAFSFKLFDTLAHLIRPSHHPVFAYCKRSETGQWEGLWEKFGGRQPEWLEERSKRRLPCCLVRKLVRPGTRLQVACND